MTGESYLSQKEGYVPHTRQSKLFCPECGGDVFRFHTQSRPSDCKYWCFEYTCAKCGWIVGVEERL